jgi:hypothetical protein
MESQQMMDFLLAMRQEINANRKADQEQAAANTKAMRENMKADLENLQVTMKTNQDDLIKTMKEGMRAMLDACHKEMMSCLGKTEADTAKPDLDSGMMQSAEEHQEFSKTKPDPGTMQSAEEHQEIPKEDAAVMSVGGLKKRRRDRNLAAGRRQNPKRRIQANCESKKRLAAACKKITRHATVAWRKRNVFRRIVTQGICGRRSTLTAAGIRTTRCAKVARGREHGLHRQGKEDTVPRPRKGRTEKNERFKGRNAKIT